MVQDDGDDDEGVLGRRPLPPEDRLWRHPSELAAMLPPEPPPPSSRSVRAVALAGVVAGVALATSVLALSGTLAPRVVERPVVEKVALTPVVSSPLLRDGDDLTRVVGRAATALVRLEVRRGGSVSTASGVVFRDDGLVLTAAHPLRGADAVFVVLADGRRLRGEVTGLDEVTDIAVVDVDAQDLPVAVLSEAPAEIGDLVVALGAADDSGQPSISAGLVTALDQRLALPDGPVLHGLVETDADVEPHQEGGPVVDARGAVVAVTTSGDGGAHGYGVPVDLARRVALHLLADGQVAHAWLGITTVDLDADQREALDVGGGALAHSLVPGGPAEAAGLQPGDVIVGVDGQPVGSVSALVVALRRCEPGDEVRLSFRRDGAVHEAVAVVAPRPSG